MRNPEVLIGIFGTIFLFGGPIAVFIVHRVLKHQERMAMIAHGMIPGDVPKTAPGPSVCCGPQAAPPPPGAQPYVSYQEFEAAQNQLRKGLTTALIGFAILIGLFFIDVSRPGPWLLGGLIPMFVGIAQVIVAILSGARLAPPGPYQQMPGAPPPPAGMNQPRASSPPGNSYAYRPGSTVELEPPAPPPDRR